MDLFLLSQRKGNTVDMESHLALWEIGSEWWILEQFLSKNKVNKGFQRHIHVRAKYAYAQSRHWMSRESAFLSSFSWLFSWRLHLSWDISAERGISWVCGWRDGWSGPSPCACGKWEFKGVMILAPHSPTICICCVCLVIDAKDGA